MYISEEQKALEKIDVDFKKKIKESKAIIKEHFDGENEAIEELPRVQTPVYKSKMLKIKDGVLVNCRTSSETVFIPQGVTEIGNEAFKNSKGLNTKIIFPNGLKKIGVSAFEDCHDIIEMDVKDSDLCYYEGVWENDLFNQFSRGFSQFPSSLEEIEDYAFRNLGNNSNGFGENLMEYLILPQNLKSVGKGAFYDAGIRAIYIAGPQAISDSCFFRSGLRKVILGDNVKNIERVAFACCSRLEKVVFGRNIKVIGDWAFEFCLSLKKVVFPDSLEKIGKGAFDECGRLTNIEIPDSVTEIGENAFSKCIGLKEVKLGTGITAIPECCFSNCTNLKKIEIPKSVTTIDDLAFKNCNKFTIYASTGSCAEQFAKENGIKFEAV